MATGPGPTVRLAHSTIYAFDRPVIAHAHVIRLRPLPYTRTPIADYGFAIDPEPLLLSWQQDPFGNHIARAVFEDPTPKLSFDVSFSADLSPFNPFEFFLEPHAAHAPFDYGPALTEDLNLYLTPQPVSSALASFIERCRPEPSPTMDFLVQLNERTREAIDYVVRLEPGVQTPDETLSTGSGSCRDSAWLLVHMLRSLGFAARFVSGYLIQLDATTVDQPSDTADLHAWAEVYVPGAGWVGLDATSGLLTAQGHIPVAAAPRHDAAAPISGATSPADVTFTFITTADRL